jgi:hypothetical protein
MHVLAAAIHHVAWCQSWLVFEQLDNDSEYAAIFELVQYI